MELVQTYKSMGTPTIVVGDKVIVGFRQAEIEPLPTFSAVQQQPFETFVEALDLRLAAAVARLREMEAGGELDLSLVGRCLAILKPGRAVVRILKDHVALALAGGERRGNTQQLFLVGGEDQGQWPAADRLDRWFPATALGEADVDLVLAVQRPQRAAGGEV